MNRMTLSCRRTLAHGLLAVLASALSGCATVTEVKRDASVPDGSGVVVLHVASAFEGHNWQYVEAWSEKEKRVYDIHREPVRDASTHEYADTAVMIGALPAGTYRLDALKDEESSGNGRTVYTSPVGEQLGKFKVEAGRVTDLGTVLYYPENAYFTSGSFLLVRLPKNADTQRSLQYKNPVAYAAVSKKPALGWLDERGVLAAPTLAQIKANLPRLFAVTETRNGDLYIGGMLGQILKRPARGSWTVLDTGTHEEIFRVVEGSDGLYAQAERLLLKTTDGGQTWKELKLPPQNGRLEFFSLAADGTQHLYIHTDGLVVNGFSLFVRARDSDPWKLATHTEFSNGLMSELKPAGYRVSDRNALQFSGGGAYRLRADGTLEQVLARNFPLFGYTDDGTFYGVEDDVELKTLEHRMRLTFLSPDGKKKEQPYEFAGMTVYDVQFTDRKTGYVLAHKAREYANRQLLKTTDGGKSWTSVKAPGFRALYVTRAGEILVRDGESIYLSSDGGNTWRRERGMVNLLALAKQMKAKKAP